MGRFRKKPVMVDAFQWWEHNIQPGDPVKPSALDQLGCAHCEHKISEHGWIDTLEGGHIVCPGDWIITGVKGEHYPCKPDIFEATYEPA